MRRGARCAWLGLVAALSLTPRLGEAQAPKARVSFAVVIGNNKSLGGRRPDLHYADDDAARYFAILNTVTRDRTYLLASFDRDTERLFPGAHARAVAPTSVELSRVGREIGDRVRAASLAKQETEVYFVFAGHGDVDAGRGFLELADRRFTASDLERWLGAIPFTRAHVILDSCNSFFMLGVRKPGGRYFATPEDAARALGTRLPNVGVFLSTSAEGESFEWSELQSGVFSHVVRSGLLGAADADQDGTVSYLELSAFVATATADVKNPNLRPHVFARGPGAHDDTPLVRVRGRTHIRRLRLSDAAPLRVRLRDAEGMPVLDAHAESGSSLELTLPEAWMNGAIVERALSPNSPSVALQSYAVPETTEVLELVALQPIAAHGATRGPTEIFSRLFMHPYGPRALAAYAADTRAAKPQVFGVSREDAARMDLLLGQIESAERNQRVLSGVVELGAGAFLGSVGAVYLASAHDLSGVKPKNAQMAGGYFLATGGLALLFGSYQLARRSAGERAAAEFRLALRTEGDYARAFAVADGRLREVAAAERRGRWVGGIVGGTVMLGSAGAIAAIEFSSPSAKESVGAITFGGAGLLLGGTLLAASLLIESPAERLLRVWNQDPSFVDLQPSLMSMPGGGLVGATGTF